MISILLLLHRNIRLVTGTQDARLDRRRATQPLKMCRMWMAEERRPRTCDVIISEAWLTRKSVDLSSCKYVFRKSSAYISRSLSCNLRMPRAPYMYTRSPVVGGCSIPGNEKWLNVLVLSKQYSTRDRTNVFARV